MANEQETNELYKALRVVHLFAQKQRKYHLDLIAEKPLNGWTQVIHNEHHRRGFLDAQTVILWAYAEMMRINPD